MKRHYVLTPGFKTVLLFLEKDEGPYSHSEWLQAVGKYSKIKTGNYSWYDVEVQMLKGDSLHSLLAL